MIILGITIGSAMIPFVETTKALTIMVSGGIAVAVVIVGTILVGFGIIVLGKAVVSIAALLAIVASLAVAGFVIIPIAVVEALIIFYISWQAFTGNEKYALIWKTIIALAAIGGTSFYNADLTDANFSEAKLKSTDFRKATLTRVNWLKTKMLDRVRPGDTYLKSSQLRQWLINKGQDNNQDNNFDRQDLRGINLQG